MDDHPHVGDTVLFFPGPNDPTAWSNGCGPEDPIAAIVTRVWSDDMVNLVIFRDSHNDVMARTSVHQKDVAADGAGYWV